MTYSSELCRDLKHRCESGVKLLRAAQERYRGTRFDYFDDPEVDSEIWELERLLDRIKAEEAGPDVN